MRESRAGHSLPVARIVRYFVSAFPALLEQRSDRHFQTGRERFHGVQRRVPPPPLDPAHVGPGKAAAIGKRLL